MTYVVTLQEAAMEDILAIVEYYQKNAGRSVATQIYQQINDAILSLENMPHRGHPPHELRQAVTTDILEVIAGHYRIIYQCTEPEVVVFAVFDGRQDVRTHLKKRRRRLKL